MGNIDTKMNIITTIKEYFWPCVETRAIVEPPVAPGDLDNYLLAAQASLAAYKSTVELNNTIETRNTNAHYWPMIEHVTKFVMFADADSDAHCTVFTYNKNDVVTLIVAFRGTEKTEGDLMADAYFRLEMLKHQNDPSIMVDEGFQYQYNVLRADLRNYLTTTYFDHLFVTGHSLGAALATLCTIDLGLNRLEKETQVTHVTVASPRVGETHFEQCFRTLNLSLTRLVLQHDPIPSVPFGFGYTHVGNEFHLNVAKDDSGLSATVPHGIKHYLKSVQELKDEQSYQQWSQDQHEPIS